MNERADQNKHVIFIDSQIYMCKLKKHAMSYPINLSSNWKENSEIPQTSRKSPPKYIKFIMIILVY